MNNSKFSFLHLLGTVLGVVVAAVSPTVRSALSTHPVLTSIFLGVYAALGVFLPQPQGGQ